MRCMMLHLTAIEKSFRAAGYEFVVPDFS